MIEMNCEDIESMDKRRRATFINCLSGYKSPFLVASKSTEGFENLAIFSSIFHLGANPPLIGMISRPNSVPRHTLENIIENGSYSLNLINESFLENAHQTSARYDRQVSEFEACGFESRYQEGFVAPYLENSKLSLFLEAKEIKELEINSTLLVIGEIKKIIIAEDHALKDDGFLDFYDLQAAASLGLDAYTFPGEFQRKAYAKV